MPIDASLYTDIGCAWLRQLVASPSPRRPGVGKIAKALILFTK
jgi:hypothetical protein